MASNSQCIASEAIGRRRQSLDPLGDGVVLRLVIVAEGKSLLLEQHQAGACRLVGLVPQTIEVSETPAGQLRGIDVQPLATEVYSSQNQAHPSRSEVDRPLGPEGPAGRRSTVSE